MKAVVVLLMFRDQLPGNVSSRDGLVEKGQFSRQGPDVKKVGLLLLPSLFFGL